VKPDSLLRGHVEAPPSPQPVAVDIPDNAPEHIAIIAAWWNALPEWARPTTDDGKPPYAQLAKRASALAARGISRADVAGYIEEKYREDFWTGKPMTFKHVADKVSAWAQTHRRKSASNPKPTFIAIPGCPECGGTGMLLPPVPPDDPRANVPLQCPACAAYEKEHATELSEVPVGA